MKKLILLLALLLFTSPLLADTVRVSVQFKKYLYTCSDGEELLVDSNNQKYTCPKSGEIVGEGWYKNVGDCLSFTKAEYDAMSQDDLAKLKQERIDKRIYEVKNPPIVVEPTPEEIQAQIDSKTQEIESLQAQKVEAVAKLQVIEEIEK
jgi:hypothetical protein